MTEYNFKPDYKKWWNKKSLSHDDLCWLLVAIDPNDAKKSIELSKKEKKTDEETQWVTHFGYYLHSLPFTWKDRAEQKG